MDFRGAVILFLILLPAYGIGYVHGKLEMRGTYLPILRKLRMEKARTERHAAWREQESRYIGYAVGYREGQRASK